MIPHMPGATPDARFPRNSGLSRNQGRDLLSKFAGPGEERPAFEETRYFRPIIRRRPVSGHHAGPAGGEKRVFCDFGVASLYRCKFAAA
jgi:hypothetical protein